MPSPSDSTVIRARFRIISIDILRTNRQEVGIINAKPVSVDAQWPVVTKNVLQTDCLAVPAPENAIFGERPQPNGSLSMPVVLDVAQRLVVGRDYYLDFVPVVPYVKPGSVPVVPGAPAPVPADGDASDSENPLSP